MNFLFKTECNAPDVELRLPNSSPTNDSVRYEDEGTLWLWAWPELLGWQYDIVWLFSPVVGRDKRPGDLWGLDSRGNLILVETKLVRGRCDPFEDFIPFDEGSIVATADSLEKYWYKLFSSETQFIEEYIHTLDLSLDDAKLNRGVVPYSYKRFVVRRWRDLYRSVIAPWLNSAGYADKVHKYLEAREMLQGSQTHYVGLLTAPKYRDVKLSRRGLEHYHQLKGKVGASKITMLAATAEPSTAGRVRIKSWSLDTP